VLRAVGSGRAAPCALTVSEGAQQLELTVRNVTRPAGKRAASAVVAAPRQRQQQRPWQTG